MLSSERTPPALASAPVLVHVTRGRFVESAHRVAVAVTAPDGQVRTAYGDVADPILPRSSNKPFQGLAMVRAGLDLPPHLLALACASHSAEEFHLDGVRELLGRGGLSEADLQNTPDLPYDEGQREAWIAAHRAPRPLAQNCSGKHAAMLLTCQLNGWDLATYLSPEHPLQRAIAATLAELAGEPVAGTEVDGCGAPVMALSLAVLARAFGRLTGAAEGTPERRVADAMRAFPEWVGGSTRDATRLMRGTPGLLAKDGAEAVFGAGLPDGTGIALKVADGSQRARPVAMVAVLRSLGVQSTAYDSLGSSPVLGHGRPVGAVAAVERPS